MRTPSLAEDKRLFTKRDEDLNLRECSSPSGATPDWASDPMELLMAKQEAERQELQDWLDMPHH